MDYAQLVQDVLDGEESALKAYAVLKAEEANIKRYMDKIKEEAISEASKWSENTFNHNGFRFTKVKGKARYSFKHIPEWAELDKKRKALEDRCKKAYQSYQQGVTSVSEDGEIIDMPEVTYSADGISVNAMK